LTRYQVELPKGFLGIGYILGALSEVREEKAVGEGQPAG
jgi:hypothetical protein